MPPVFRAIRQGMVGLALLAAFPCAPAIHAHAQTFTATTVTELVNDITSANAVGGASTITLVAGTTYTLTTDTPAGSGTGLPPITSDLTIAGNGATIARSTAGGTPNFRLFAVSGTGTLRLDALTVRNGRTVGTAGPNGGNGSGGHRDGFNGTDGATARGGAIVSNGTLIVTRSGIVANGATGGAGGNGGDGFTNPSGPGGSGGNAGMGGDGIGGAIASSGTLTITNSTFTANSATGGAGGNGGAAGTGAGGVNGNAGVSAHGGNGPGGAIANLSGDTVTATNVTIAGNSAFGGIGGIGPNPGGNGDAVGGGLFNNGSTTVTNTLLAANVASGSGNCAGSALTDGGYNLDFNPNATCGFANNARFGDPQLSALADHGGPSWTMAIGASSAARGNGNAAVCGASPVGGTDQRNLPRPPGQCSIGAFEWWYWTQFGTHHSLG